METFFILMIVVAVVVVYGICEVEISSKKVQQVRDSKQLEDEMVEETVKTQQGPLDDERILEDDYPVYYNYWYLIKNQYIPEAAAYIPVRSPVQGDVRALRNYLNSNGELNVTEVRRCSAVKRKLPLEF